MIHFLLWVGWIIIRLLMCRFLVFNFHEAHHYDLGFAFVIQGVALTFWPLIIIGAFVMTDDIIGHNMARLGQPELGPLKFIYVKLWRLLKRR